MVPRLTATPRISSISARVTGLVIGDDRQCLDRGTAQLALFTTSFCIRKARSGAVRKAQASPTLTSRTRAPHSGGADRPAPRPGRSHAASGRPFRARKPVRPKRTGSPRPCVPVRPAAGRRKRLFGGIGGHRIGTQLGVVRGVARGRGSRSARRFHSDGSRSGPAWPARAGAAKVAPWPSGVALGIAVPALGR